MSSDQPDTAATQWCPYCKRHVPLTMHTHDAESATAASAVLNRTLDAVEAIHQPVHVHGEDLDRCSGCSAPERGHLVPWPCPTREAIMRGLDGT